MSQHRSHTAQSMKDAVQAKERADVEEVISWITIDLERIYERLDKLEKWAKYYERQRRNQGRAYG